MKICKHKFNAGNLCLICNKTIKEAVTEAWDIGEALALEAKEKNIPATELMPWVLKQLE